MDVKMELIPLKRIKIEPNFEDPNPWNLNPQPEYEGALLPTNVLQLVLVSLRSLSFAKLCRQVCKSWNTVACGYLRLNSKVHLDEGNPPATQKFQELLLERLLNLQPEFPSPFQDYEINVKTFSDRVFTHIVQQRLVNVVSVRVYPGKDVDFMTENFTRFLESKKDTITGLGVYASPRVIYPMTVNPLRSLVRFEFLDTCDRECLHTTFVQSILQQHHLQQLRLHVKVSGRIAELLQCAQTSSLITLKVWCELPFSDDDVNVITSLQFPPSLRNLIIVCPPNKLSLVSILKFLQQMERVTEQLVYMGTMIKPKDIPFVFPILRTLLLFVRDGDAVSGCSATRFPSLTSVSIVFGIYKALQFRENDFSPIQSVTQLNLACVCGPEFLPGNLDRIFMTVRHQFPNIRNLILSLQEFPSEFFTILKSCYPQLTSLHLHGQCSFETFTGLYSLEELLELGWSVSQMVRRPSIIDFPDLKELAVGKFALTDKMKMYGTDFLPKLQALRENVIYKFLPDVIK